MKQKQTELTAIFTPEGFTLRETLCDTNGYFNKSLLEDFTQNKIKALYELGFLDRNKLFSPSLAFLHNVALTFVGELSKDADIEIKRQASPISDKTVYEIMKTVPFSLGFEHINFQWLVSIWNELCGVFNAEMSNFSGTVEDYLRNKNSNINIVGRVFFHLVESKDEEYPFAFMATYSTGTSQSVSHMPLKNALVQYKDNTETLLGLLKTVTKVSDKSDFISELVESGEMFSPLKFTEKDAYVFLREVPMYEENGVVCRIPDWWKRKGMARVSVSVGGNRPSSVGLDAMLSFNAEVFIGDLQLSRSEIEALLEQTNGLSYLKGRWVEVDHDKLRSVLDALEKVENGGDMTLSEVLRLQMGLGSATETEEEETVEFTNGQWLSELMNDLRNPHKIEAVESGEHFKAALRHYQQDGLNWLYMMNKTGFGALLADDMGLGKTVQILALLDKLRLKTLLVIPASLIHNWQAEADKFAPMLKYVVIHSNQKTIDINSADLFITTYGMLVRTEEISEVDWDLLILDEAQAIKNPGTKQTKAVKAIKAKSRIAMTGTPIENRLSDLWSLFDFLNKGLLGTAKEFSSFAKKLNDNASGYSRLREIVSPFILRRLKTDKTVISDLPDKVEIKAYTALTKKQVVLYTSLVKEIEKSLQVTDEKSIDRKGLVLASLMKFKQICNHPDQYLGQKSFEHTQSGKFSKLAEICETIAEKQERVLVFTQFKEMAEPISNYLTELFGKKGLVLHGGTAVKKRGELVELFNSEEYIPYMVLSLKAGGVGLNLTAANHVIHFDRWWNPAIENQATDRAFRIGQQKNVIVHKFVTEGTIEEKIDKMLEEKQKLAGDIISSSGEAWITELGNKELLNLFRLEV